MRVGSQLGKTLRVPFLTLLKGLISIIKGEKDQSSSPSLYIFLGSDSFDKVGLEEDFLHFLHTPFCPQVAELKAQGGGKSAPEELA